MKKTLLRVYDKNNEHANTGNVYFLVLPENFDINNDEHYHSYVFPNLCAISGMAWQKYTSYVIGTADINESELFWSEITNYNLKECKIDNGRLTVTGRYKLPESIINMI